MSPTAQRAQLDFVRLAAAEPSSLYFERFLRDGFAAWPASYQRRFPGLMSWPGIAGLKRSLQSLAGAPEEGSVLLASRSLVLVKLAARSMFRVCRHVLTTDLSWPTYQSALEQRARLSGARITVIPLRDQILHDHWTTSDVASDLATAFADQGCDGLFLPIVNHLGIRLPIREIVTSICGRSRLQYCLLDAAQAFCQVPIDCFECADFVVAGSHKWLGAYLPIGIGFVNQNQRIADGTWGITDPLLRFTQQLDGGAVDGHSETANLTPLLACGGAVRDRIHESPGPGADFPIESIQDWLPRSLGEWQPLRPCPALRSRISLLEGQDAAHQHASADALRRKWLDAGCVVTAYPGGRVRLSAPPCHEPQRSSGLRRRIPQVTHQDS